MTFRDLFLINNNLRDFSRELEKYLSINIDDEIIEKIFNDADGYEAETILIVIQNIDRKALKHFTALASDIGLFGRIL